MSMLPYMLISGLAGFLSAILFPAEAVQREESDARALFEHPADSLLGMFWNVENFFDWKDCGSGASDHEFSPGGDRHWTAGRFYRKCNVIAKSIYWISDRYGRLPDVVGLAEVENREVLIRLIYGTALRKAGYSIVHYDSPDHRGIDVAILYRKDIFRLLSSKSCHVDSLKTRDILLSCLVNRRSGDTLSFIVVHLPSKYGGKESEWKRAMAARRLNDAADSLYHDGFRNIIVCGDFNDTPEAEAFCCLEPLLVNTSETLAGEGMGTVRFDGKWNLIDMFWVTRKMANDVKMSIVQIPFLITRDNVMAGEKPLRTYSGPRYIGGVSDHCPIILEISL